MVFRPGAALGQSAALEHVHDVAVLTVDAQNAMEGLDRLQDVQQLVIPHPQRVVGEIGFERGHACLPQRGQLGPGVLVPVGDRHMERIVAAGHAPRLIVPLGQRTHQGAALVLRGKVAQGGRAAAHGRQRAGGEVVRRVHPAVVQVQMGVPVNEAGEHPATRNVKNLVRVLTFQKIKVGRNLDDFALVHQQIRPLGACRRDEGAVL